MSLVDAREAPIDVPRRPRQIEGYRNGRGTDYALIDGRGIETRVEHADSLTAQEDRERNIVSFTRSK